MCSTEGISSKSGSISPLLKLPNELFFEVASHLKSFKDVNSLARTSCFLHGIFNPHLYRRAVTANRIVRDRIVGSVLSRHPPASLALLLDNGLSVNHAGQFPGGIGKEAMLRFLCRLGQERSVPLARLLIQRGADIEEKDSKAQTLLHITAMSNNCGIAALFLAQPDGPGVNAEDKFGRTPLHYVSSHGHEMIKLLIAHGAAVDARDWGNSTPLYWALLRKNFDIVPTLLAHGSDGGARIGSGETLLHYVSACFSNSEHKVAKLLLEHGAQVNATDLSGRTPLHWVFEAHSGEARLALNGYHPMAKFLLEKGADVNAISNDGLSPLQRALSRYSDEATLAILLKHGADVKVLSKEERRLLRIRTSRPVRGGKR
jgi:ankyrin repeat protein